MNTKNITVSRIANRKSQVVNGLCLVSCILCLILIYSHVVFAQEAELRVRRERVDGAPNPAAIIVDVRPGDIIIEDVDAGERPVIQRASGETPDARINMDREIEVPDGREPVTEEETPQRDEPAKESSTSGSMDPEEIKKRMLERRKRVMEGKQADLWPEETQEAEPEPEVQQQPFGERRRGGEQPGGPAGNERQDYVSAIVNNNLFSPLGSGGERPRTQYALTAVISNSTDETEPIKKAVIEERGGNRSYYVHEGDTFSNDDIAVEVIEEDVVTLDREGEPLRLVLGEGTSSGSGGGGRSGRRSGGGGNAPGGPGDGGDFDVNQIPENARRMLQERGINVEELRNNPELQNRLRGEFMQRFGGGGGRPDMRNFRRPGGAGGGGGNFGRGRRSR